MGVRINVFAGVGLLLLLAPAAHCQEDSPLAGFDTKEAEKLAMGMAKCAGLWDWLASGLEAEGKPASAQQMHNIGNGAETAAMWILANHHLITSGKRTTYGSWSPLTAPKREAAVTWLNSMAEIGDLERINEESATCQSLLEAQESVIQMMRRDQVDAAQEQG